MRNPAHLDRYAQVLWWGLTTSRKGRFRKNDIVLLRYDPLAAPLAERVFDLLIRRGVNPVVRVSPTPSMEKSHLRWGSARQLTFRSPGDQELFKALNGSIAILAPQSLTHLKGISPDRIGKVLVSRKVLRDILMARDQAGQLGWTLGLYPTDALAHHAGLPMDQYEHQIVRSCFLHRRDPVAQWREILKKVTAIKRWLGRLDIQRLRVTSAHCDVAVTPGAHRRWLGLSGHNIPSFEVFLSPDWRGTHGVYHADQPSFRSGNRVRGVTLEFKEGVVVRAKADQGQRFLRQQLRMDRGAGRVGEFSLTDRRFSKITRFMANTLYDENFGGRQGNCHLAVGSAYGDSYDGPPAALTPARKRALGFNDSALHWDLVNTEKKRVVAQLKGGGRQTIYENGCFQL
jgi:aminopeptidase